MFVDTGIRHQTSTVFWDIANESEDNHEDCLNMHRVYLLFQFLLYEFLKLHFVVHCKNISFELNHL